MEYEVAEQIIKKVQEFNASGKNASELACLKKGTNEGNVSACFRLIVQLAGKVTINDIWVIAPILSVFVSNGCKNGEEKFSVALAKMCKSEPTLKGCAQHIFTADTSKSFTLAVETSLKAMHRNLITPDYAKLICDAVKFETARNSFINKWASEFDAEMA